MIKFRLITAITSFLLLTACGSYSEDSSTLTIQNDGSSDMMQSESNDVFVSETVPPKQSEVTTAEQEEENSADGMQITIGEQHFTVSLENNDTVKALTEMLPISLDMSELNGNEKYCYLDTALPSAPEKIGHIHEGDIMLYGDSCLVVFYKSFDTSYTYTRIGHIDDTSGLADALGTGGATVSLSLI